MAYATAQDLIDRYGDYALIVASDRDNDGVSDPGVVATTLDDATGLINSYLTERYTLPLPTVPGTLKRCCVDIAMYQMSADCGVQTKEQRQRYEDCIAWLKDVARGLVNLGLETPTPDEAPARGYAAFDVDDRVMTPEALKGFI